MDGIHKIELQKLINSENGINYHRNVNLNGYTVYRGKSFISFRLLNINNKEVVIIDYMFMTSKKDLLQLLSWCVNFWSGNAVKYIYYKEHHKKSNIAEKCLPSLGFHVQQSTYDNWKYEWTSTNGFDENEIIEAFTSEV